VAKFKNRPLWLLLAVVGETQSEWL